MQAQAQRQITEREVDFVEEAFSEHLTYGCTTKRCPWCDGELKFDSLVSGYIILCTKCAFKVTVRGI